MKSSYNSTKLFCSTVRYSLILIVLTVICFCDWSVHQALAQSGQVIFSDNAESGVVTDKWSKLFSFGPGTEYSSVIVHSGMSAIAIDGGVGVVFDNLNNKTFEMWMYDDMSTAASRSAGSWIVSSMGIGEWGAGNNVHLGIVSFGPYGNEHPPDDVYALYPNSGSVWIYGGKRRLGWHKFAIYLNEDGSAFKAFIDGTKLYEGPVVNGFNGQTGLYLGAYSDTQDSVQSCFDDIVVTDGDIYGEGEPDVAGVWIGLKNSDDQGTQFDLRTEVYKGETLVASGETACVTGVTRNPSMAKLVMIPVGNFSGLFGSGDQFSVRVLTRIGTNPDGTKCSGPGGSHSNAVGLRLYYDSVSQSSGITFGLSPYFMHLSGTNFFLDAQAPATPSSKYQDSAGVNFLKGNPWKEIKTWRMIVP